MNKLAKIIVILLGLSREKGQRVSFTDHKKDLLKHHRGIHQVYVDWYEQELLLLRDMIFAHGNTLITPWRVSWESGITILKRSELGPLKEKQKTDFLKIKHRYEARYSNLQVTDNDCDMLDDFLNQTRKLNIRLDEADVEKLRSIVSSFGIAIDEEFLESIARHLEGFVKEVSIIFRNSL
jgi:hypothetical protein